MMSSKPLIHIDGSERLYCISAGEIGDYYYCGCHTRAGIAKNKEIDCMLAEQRKRENKQPLLLLLGTGESGKTTFMKQMRIIHGKGFSEDERCSYTKMVFQNIFQAMNAITEVMNTLKIPYSNPQNENRMEESLSLFYIEH